MTPSQRTRATTSRYATRLGIAGAAIALGVLGPVGSAAAEPVTPTPAPGQPVYEPADGSTPAPGQPVAETGEAAPPAPPAPPPVGAPPVPQIANPQYGSGNGPLGSLRDAWRQAKDPFNYAEAPPGTMPAGVIPPGAGPAPKLPPGYTSINAPDSSTPASEKPMGGGPALPEGYYPIEGPPPPGYEWGVPPPPPPPDPNAPKPYVPVVSPPPPPLYPPNP